MKTQTLYQNPTSKRAAATANQEESLQRLADDSEMVIYRCTSIFPFTLFPDSIIVTPQKVEIVYQNFFFSRSQFTLLFEDIRTVKINTDPFFATMMFEVMGYEQNPDPVKFLPKYDADTLRKIVLGITKAKREQINFNGLSAGEIRRKAHEIGSYNQEI